MRMAINEAQSTVFISKLNNPRRSRRPQLSWPRVFLFDAAFAVVLRVEAVFFAMSRLRLTPMHCGLAV